MQREASLVYFYRTVAGVACIGPGALSRRTDTHRAWVRRYATERQIPVVAAPRGARKEDLVRPYYRRPRGEEGVACVLTSLEQGRTFVSYTPRTGAAAEDPNARLIRACRKRVLHYYVDVLDPVLGPLSPRVATYPPSNVTCSLNGHAFVARELARAGVAVELDANVFVRVADPTALEAAAARLTPALLRERRDHWTGELVPVFSADERAAADLAYRYSLAQVELATDARFRRAAPLAARFRRATELGVPLGGADRVSYLFGRRITRRYAGQLRTVLEQREAGHPVPRAYYKTSFVKQYEKAARILRTETCINDPYHLGIGRRLENLPTLVERMRETNARYPEVQAELLASTIDAGALAALAQPTRVGARRIPGLALHDDRVLRLLEALLHPGTLIADWTTRDIHTRLLARHRPAADAYRLSQLRYDLTKLRAKGLVERLGSTRRYRLTATGRKPGTLLVKLRTRPLGPRCSLATAPPALTPPPAATSAVEAAFHQVDRALDHLCSVLGMTAAETPVAFRGVEESTDILAP